MSKRLGSFVTRILCVTAASAPLAALAEGNFAFDLYRRASGSGNFVVSPYALSQGLGMLREGAKGATAAELNKLLGSPLATPEGVPASLANRAWVQSEYTVLPAYKKAIVKYGASVESADLLGDTGAAVKLVNAWVAEQTRGKSRGFLREEAIEDMVVTNAVFVKGEWAKGFDKALTKKDDFEYAKGKKSKIDFMEFNPADFAFSETEGFQAVELPYRENRFALIVFLPREGKSLKEVEKSVLGAALLPAVRQGLKPTSLVRVKLPKFSQRLKQDFAGALTSLGLKTAIGKEGDYSGINGTKELKVLAYPHETIFEISEAGAEVPPAPAALEPGGTAPPAQVVPAKPEFVANHPFLYMVVERETNTPIVIGRYARP